MANNVYKAKNEYSHVPTEQLDEMLSSMSLDELYPVLEELERRDPVPEAKVQAAWEDFQRDWAEEPIERSFDLAGYGGWPLLRQ